jgi:hypothetical protein
MVEKRFTKGEPTHANKILAHLLRMYLLANQIAFFGKITDWNVANKYAFELRENPLNSFEEVTSKYTHVIGTLQNQLKTNCFGDKS